MVKGGKNMIYRGNVIEVREDSLVVMLDDSTFESVKKFKGLEEGMEIYFEQRDIIRKSNSSLKNIALIAASILLFIVTSFYGVDVWNTNYRAIAIVSVDINPSVEIKINKNHNVINAIALNEDAKKLPLNDLKNQPIDKALEELVNMARVEGYIKDEEENYILVTSVELRKDAKEEKILTDLISEGKEKIEISSIEAGEKVEVLAIRSSKETLKKARKENISVGKRELKKEEKELEPKLKENQKTNNKDNDNKKYNEITKEEKDKVKEAIKQEKDDFKEQIRQEKNKLKEEEKLNKNKEKEMKKEEKDKEKQTKYGCSIFNNYSSLFYVDIFYSCLIFFFVFVFLNKFLLYSWRQATFFS